MQSSCSTNQCTDHSGVFRRPPALCDGDSIGVIATGAPLSPERYKDGAKAIEDRGFKVIAPIDPSRDYGKYENYWSNGSVLERFEALKSLFENDSVKAIITARGGYGTSHLLPLLATKAISSNPKPIVGLSDVTPLLAYQAFKAGVHAVHGSPLGASLADSSKNAVAKSDTDDLFQILSDPGYKASHKCSVLRAGEAEGQILVGNLSMLVGMLGTPWDLDYSGKLLVIEEVGEAPFKIHRLLSHLAFAGKFNGLAGLVFARFAKCEAPHGPSVDDVFSIVLSDILGPYSFPVYSGLELGHWGRNVPLGLACKAQLKAGNLNILEAVVA